MRSALEREIKLGAPPGFALPDLGDAVRGLTMRPAGDRVLDATYYDAGDLRLIREGVTVRHRTGDTDGEGTWTVKLPDASGAVEGGLARSELEVDGPPSPIPAEVLAAVASRLRTASLEAVARLRTTRRRSLLVDDRDQMVAEIDDDSVDVLEDDASTIGVVVARFRELEVELAPDAPDSALAAVVKLLRAAGAGAPDPTPKLARALGPRALRPPDLVTSKVAKRATAEDAVRIAITSSVLRIVENDPAVRAGDAEGVHQARVGTRRLRSDLRTFAPLLDRAWADQLRDELAWLADALGAVRDADVLIDRLEAAARSLPPGDHAIADSLLSRLRAERDDARDRLLGEVLDSDRYRSLLDALVAAAGAPRVTRRADRRARKVGPGLVRRPWRKVKREVAALGAEPADAELHRVRIRAKRARYAAGVAIPVVGAPARKLEAALATFQDVLGEHHDCVVAEAWLRRAGTGPYTDSGDALVAGQLIGLQRAEAARLRGEWRTAWKVAKKAGRGRWLS